MTQAPPPHQTRPGLVAAIVIAVILLALTWPNNTGYDYFNPSPPSER